MATQLETGIDWGSSIAPPDIWYYFAEEGDFWISPNSDPDFHIADQWFTYEIGQFDLAFGIFEQFLNVSFVETSAAIADIILITDDEFFGVSGLGVFGPPSTGLTAGIGVFNWDGLGWDAFPGGALEQGGYGFVTIIHELGSVSVTSSAQ